MPHSLRLRIVVMCYYFSYSDTPSKTCIKCNTACSTCSGPVNNAIQCTSCSGGYYSSTVNGPCSNCYVGCATCTALSNTSCSSCAGTYFFLSSNNSCVSSCPPLYYPSESLNQCISCDITCLTCDGSGPSFCTSCSTGAFLSGTQCVTLCTIPRIGYVSNNTCISSCPYNNYVQTSDNTCRPCPANCAVCFNSTYCTTCLSGAYLSSNLCVTSCPASTYPNTLTSSCSACHSTCLTCWASLEQNCLSCPATRYLYNSTCSLACPLSTFTSSTLCIACDATCSSCTGPTVNNCSACAVGYFYHLNRSVCVTDCPEGDSVNNDLLTCWSCLSGEVTYTNECKKCEASCKECTSADFEDCTQCPQTRSLHYGICVCDAGMVDTGGVGCEANPNTLSTVFLAFLLTNVILCILLEALFRNKTNLLIMISFLQ